MRTDRNTFITKKTHFVYRAILRNFVDVLNVIFISSYILFSEGISVWLYIILFFMSIILPIRIFISLKKNKFYLFSVILKQEQVEIKYLKWNKEYEVFVPIEDLKLELKWTYRKGVNRCVLKFIFNKNNVLAQNMSGKWYEYDIVELYVNLLRAQGERPTKKELNRIEDLDHYNQIFNKLRKGRFFS